jgi:uncharacterized protein YjbI with pentapeptide repeats
VGCTFVGCDLSQANWAGSVVRECRFEECILGADCFAETRFNEVRFLRCHLVGTRFAAAQRLIFDMEFSECALTEVDFSGLRIRGFRLEGCRLDRCDFGGADLRNARFRECDLEGSKFGETDLTGADFTTARNYGQGIASVNNVLERAQFSMPEAALIAARLKVG